VSRQGTRFILEGLLEKGIQNTIILWIKNKKGSYVMRYRKSSLNIIHLVMFLFFLCIIFEINPFSGKNYLLSEDIINNMSPWSDSSDIVNWQDQSSNRLLGDSITLFYPCRVLLKKNIFRNFSLWNPYILCGAPFLANNQSAVFNPFNIILPFVSSLMAMTIHALLSSILAAFFMYKFLIHKKLNIISAFTGAIIFSLSGFFITYLEWGVFNGTVAWIPAVLFSMDKVFSSRNKYKYVFMGSLAVVFQAFSGQLQLFVYSMMIYLLYLLYLLTTTENKKYNAIISLLMLGFGLIMASVQILPTLEFASLSGRDTARSLDYILESSMPLGNFLTALIPNILGSNASGFYLGRMNVVSGGCIFLGFTSFFLIILSLIGAEYKKLKVFFVFLSVFSLSIATGVTYPFFYHFVPGFKLFGYVSRMGALHVFSASVLAAIGMDAMIRGSLSKKGVGIFIRSFKIFAGMIVVLGIILVTVVISRYEFFVTFLNRLSGGLENFLGFTLSHDLLSHKYRGYATYLAIQILLFLVVLFLLWIICYFYEKRYFFKKKILFYAIPILIVGELSIFSHDFNIEKSYAKPFPVTESIKFLISKKKEGLYRIARYKNEDNHGKVVNWLPQLLAPNLGMLYGLHDIQGYDSLTIYNYLDFLTLINEDSRKVKKPYPLTSEEHLK